MMQLDVIQKLNRPANARVVIRVYDISAPGVHPDAPCPFADVDASTRRDARAANISASAPDVMLSWPNYTHWLFAAYGGVTEAPWRMFDAAIFAAFYLEGDAVLDLFLHHIATSLETIGSSFQLAIDDGLQDEPQGSL